MVALYWAVTSAITSEMLQGRPGQGGVGMGGGALPAVSFGRQQRGPSRPGRCAAGEVAAVRWRAAGPTLS